MSPTSENGTGSGPSGKIGIVALRYGPDVLGGAERILRGIAEQLHARGYEVEALTTCGRDMADWKDHYPSGETLINDVPVRRFPVDQVDMGQIFRTLHKVASGERVSYSEQIKFIQQHYNSLALCQYIRDHYDEFACFIFGPYLFGTTYWGMKAAPDKGVLLPCLHDEPIAYLTIYRELLKQARGILFNADAERRFAIERLGMVNPAHEVVGYGFDPTTPRGRRGGLPPALFATAGVLLYSGRLDGGKNVHLLLDYFARYKAERPGSLTLVLCGAGDVLAGGRTDVAELGFFAEEPLRDAYAAATLMCQPSVNESFSIVIMEAWLQGTPVFCPRRLCRHQRACRQERRRLGLPRLRGVPRGARPGVRRPGAPRRARPRRPRLCRPRVQLGRGDDAADRRAGEFHAPAQPVRAARAARCAAGARLLARALRGAIR